MITVKAILNFMVFVVTPLLGIFFYSRSLRLTKENNQLKADNSDKEQLLETHRELNNVIKNTKDTDLNGNIKRMRDSQL